MVQQLVQDRRGDDGVAEEFTLLRLAGGTGDGPQPDPLDGANLSGRTDRYHQDSPATVIRSGGTAHPLGAPPHFASSQALALGKPKFSRALARLRAIPLPA